MKQFKQQKQLNTLSKKLAKVNAVYHRGLQIVIDRVPVGELNKIDAKVSERLNIAIQNGDVENIPNELLQFMEIKEVGNIEKIKVLKVIPEKYREYLEALETYIAKEVKFEYELLNEKLVTRGIMANGKQASLIQRIKSEYASDLQYIANANDIETVQANVNKLMAYAVVQEKGKTGELKNSILQNLDKALAKDVKEIEAFIENDEKCSKYIQEFSSKNKCLQDDNRALSESNANLQDTIAKVLEENSRLKAELDKKNNTPATDNK